MTGLLLSVRKPQLRRHLGYICLPTKRKSRKIAKVVAVGSNVKEVKVDNRIVVREYSTSDIKVNDVEYLIVKEEDVLAVVTD